MVSPLAWPLAYRFPVHTISPDNQPHLAPAAPTYLIVYRDRNDKVRFHESNPVTARLLELLGDNAPGAPRRSGQAAVAQVLEEARIADRQGAQAHGVATLESLRHADIIVGTAIRSDPPAEGVGEA